MTASSDRHPPEDRHGPGVHHDPPTPGPPGPATDLAWLREAVNLSRLCPRSTTAFAVGAVIVTSTGQILATGYSREADPLDHAEEAALAKLPPDHPHLRNATIYTSLEPCTTRASRPQGCTQLILTAAIPRVVFAWHEPDVFTDCTGAETLREAGVEVIELPTLAPEVRAVNSHLFPS
ncbi:deaminase [Sphaerisporangium aureirubrum]|uniref:Deaminase n=1 Tax=Sphaerisporangium aureirubrum TaxID=1544736 RepID=A0ABW1NHI6_9ACTN